MAGQRDHSQADRPYLRSYVSDVLSLSDGPARLAKMMSDAETAKELLNYDPQHAVIATKAVLQARLASSPAGFDQKFEHSGVGRLAKSLKRDVQLYDAFVQTFNDDIENVLRDGLSGEFAEFNRRVLARLADKHTGIKQAWERAQKAVPLLSCETPPSVTPHSDTSPAARR